LNIDDRAAQIQFVQQNGIDIIFHLATGPEQWLACLLVLLLNSVSSAFSRAPKVFNPDSNGPFTPDHPAYATGDYGPYKIRVETAVCSHYPKAINARFGWQMFDTFKRDNLLSHVRDMVNNEGVLFASTEWKPCECQVIFPVQGKRNFLVFRKQNSHSAGR